MAESKQYLGDSVYVDIANGMLRLTTENGMEPSNVIYLEPQVYEALVRYSDQHFLVDEATDAKHTSS